MRGMAAASNTQDDKKALDDMLTELSNNHREAKMRVASILIESAGIHLWATYNVQLSNGKYRITWRYEEREGDEVIMCYTLAESN